MELSIILAKFWGLYLLIISLALLFNKKNIKILFDSFSTPESMMMSGFLSLFIGLFMVLKHNIWVNDWTVIITIFGWLALLKGICRIFFPEALSKRLPKFKNSSFMPIAFFLALLLGLYLTIVGFNS